MEKYMLCEFKNSDTENKYTLISTWHNDFIDLILLGLNSAWRSQVTLENSSIYVSKLHMNYEDYKNTFRMLFDPESSKHFKLVFENKILKWVKVVNEDLSIMHGLFIFDEITECEEAVGILETLSTNFIRLREQIGKLEEQNREIKNHCSIMAENFQQCAEEKLNIENTLYTKFIKVLEKNKIKKQLAGPGVSEIITTTKTEQ